jgi:hypothetical protein
MADKENEMLWSPITLQVVLKRLFWILDAAGRY